MLDSRYDSIAVCYDFATNRELMEENVEERSAATPGVRRDEDIALDLMKFVAVTTGYGKGNTTAAGFSGKPAKSTEEYADALIQLFEKCRAVVARPVQES